MIWTIPSTTLKVSILNSTLTNTPLGRVGKTCPSLRHNGTRRNLSHLAGLCSTKCPEGASYELRRDGVIGSTHGPGPMLILSTDALWALLERALRREAAGAAGSGTFREQMLTSRQMPCRQAEAAGRGVPKRSLRGRRRAPGAPAPQEDDPGRCEAQLDPLDAVPAFLPARVAADLWVEPDAWALRLEHPFVGRVVLRVVPRRAGSAAIDGVARAERLHRRRARPEGAGDPLVAPVLVHPTADVVYELPERNPLIYSHARNHLPILGVAGCATGSTRPKRCPTVGRASVPLPSFPSKA